MSYSFQCMPFTSLFNIIPRYFILFDTFINGIVFLISLSHNLLLVYRHAVNFCLLILYPATLLNSVSLTVFFFFFSDGFFRVFYVKSSTNSEFCFFLSNLDAFYFFALPIALARASNNMLNKVVKVGIFVFFLILKEDWVWFSCGLVIYSLYYVEVWSLFTHFVFITNGC